MIIGFTGGMGVGKSTAVKLVKEAYFTSLSKTIKFAQPLYDIQEYVYKRIEDVYTRPSDFEKDRKLLQWIGTDWGRNTISDTLWVHIWGTTVHKFISTFGEESIVLCDDVRFDNEAQEVKAMGGLLIKISSDHVQDRRVAVDGLPSHQSESGVSLKFIDYEIKNDSSLGNFEQELLKVIKSFAARRGTKD